MSKSERGGGFVSVSAAYQNSIWTEFSQVHRKELCPIVQLPELQRERENHLSSFLKIGKIYCSAKNIR